MSTPQLDELVGAYPNYNEEEEERRYYRRKRLGVVRNVLAASAGGALTYSVYLGRDARCRVQGVGCGVQPAPTRPGKEKPKGSPRGCFLFRFPPAVLQLHRAVTPAWRVP